MSIDPPTLRERAEHAAKYGANLVVPAREIKELLDEGGAMIGSIAALNARITELQTNLTARDAALHRIRLVLATADRHQNAFIRTRQLRTALDGAALAEDGDPR